MVDQDPIDFSGELSPTKKPLPEPNPLTRAAHRREVFWQVTFPLLLGGTILAAVAVLTVWGTALRSDTVNRWGWISMIWLFIPLLFFTLVVIAFFGGLVYLVTRLLSALPPYARMIQDFFAQVAGVARVISDKAVEPFFRVQSWRASIRALTRRLQR